MIDALADIGLLACRAGGGYEHKVFLALFGLMCLALAIGMKAGEPPKPPAKRHKAHAFDDPV